MKKRILAALPALLLLAACLAGCARQAEMEEPEQIQQSLPPDSPFPQLDDPEFAQNTAPFNPAEFTKEQMLEDYDYFWSMLEENCPLLPLVGRAPGSDMDSDQLKAFGREKVLALADGDAEGFCEAMAYVSSLFHNIGHIGVVASAGPHSYVVRMEERNDENSPQLWQIYTDEKAAAFYAWQMQLPYYRSVLESQYRQKNAASSQKPDENPAQPAEDLSQPSLSLHQGVPVIKIPTFHSSQPEQTIDRLKELCMEQIQAPDLILDLRGNNGGNTDIWMKGLFPLYQGKEVKQRGLLAYKNTAYNRQIWGEEACRTRLDPVSQPIEALFSSSLTQTENLNREDLAGCDRFALMTFLTIRPKPETEPLFQGKLWILTDSNVYSAAEAFVQFAQSSGLAIVVGENTSGNGVLPMSPPKIPFLLPNSGMIAQYTPFYSINPDGSCIEEAGSAPDIDASQRDALEVCLEQIAQTK